MIAKENSFIDLNLYHVFYTVFKCGSYSKAAEKLFVTQPAITYSIKKLETILGIQLFVREKNKLKVTEGAKEIIPYVEEALYSFHMGKKRIEEKLMLRNKEIRIGIPSHIAIFLLVDLMKVFAEENKDIYLKVVCKTTNELLKLLKNKQIDILIDSSPIEIVEKEEYTIKKISEEKYYFACHVKDTNLYQNKMDLNTLSKLDLIVPLSTTSATKELKEIFQQANVDFHPKFEIATSEMIVEMVEKQIGIGYLYEKTINRYKDMAKIELVEQLPSSQLFLIYKKNMISDATERLIEYMNRYLKQL